MCYHFEEYTIAATVGGMERAWLPYEVLNEEAVGDLLLTCEHASNELPPGWNWPEADAHLVNMHWGIDIGARDLTLELVAELKCCAILAR